MKIHHVLATALVAATVALLPSPVHAADDDKDRTTVGVRTATEGDADDRGRYEYEILPSQSRQDAIAVYNYSTRSVTVRLLARDATSTPQGEFSAQPSKDRPEDVGSWIALDKQVLTMKPRSMTVVPFQVGVPYNATPGDHAGSILVSLLAKEPKKSGESVVVEHRVGLRVYLRVPGAIKPALEVENLRTQYRGSWFKKSLGFGTPVADYKVRNTGNVRLSVEQQVQMLRSFGLAPATKKPAGLKELLPGGFARVHQEFGGTWAVGHVAGKVTLRPSGLDESVKNVPPVVEETSVLVLPWLLLLIVLLVLTGGVLGERRRRRLKALRLPGGSRRAARSERPKVGAATFAAVLIGVAVASTAAAAPAHADQSHPTWKATVVGGKGLADDPIELQTSGGCPKPADSILAKVYGKGFPREGTNVIGNTMAGVTPKGPFPAPLAYSLKEFLTQESNAANLSGVYRIVVTCRTKRLPASYGDYVARIRFTDPGHWVAMKPVTDAVGPNLPLDENGAPIDKPGTTGGDPSADPSSGASGGPSSGSSSGTNGDGEAQTATGDTPALTASETSGGNSAGYLLVGGGVLILAATGFVLWRRRA